jgi:type VI secretion system protein ImpL
LPRLETLRQSLTTLTEYQNHTPLRLRWGLYVGDQLYCDVRKTYYNRFYSLLLRPTQASFEDWLMKLPSAAGAADDYRLPYDTLKAYLITLSHPEKSTQEFLGPMLLSRWESGRAVDQNLKQLAKNQFDTYANELAAGSPGGCTVFLKREDTPGVVRARAYLNSFGDVDRVYTFMLAEAAKHGRSIIFNRDVPGSAQAVTNRYEVPAAFTKAGWAFMQDAFKNLPKYYGGEQWVLGPTAAAKADYASLEQKLRDKYREDYIKHWRAFMRASSVNSYTSPSDAAMKLSLVSSGGSPLFALFAMVSQHTGVDPEISRALQPPRWVEPAGAMEQLIGDRNREYATALAKLQNSMQQYALSPQAAVAQATRLDAANARNTLIPVALNFSAPPQGNVNEITKKLMDDPIKHAEDLLKGAGPREVNEAARALCGQFRGLMQKYPFNPASTVEASPQETNEFFRPGDGKFWAFYDSKLKNLLTLQGTQFVDNPAGGGDVRITPGFRTFLNHVATFTAYVYPGGSPQPKLAYTLRPQPSEGVDAVTLVIEGQTLGSSTLQPVSKQFVWPGPAPGGVTVTLRMTGGSVFDLPAFPGFWAVFRFFRDADWQSGAGPDYSLNWSPRVGAENRPLTMAGKPVILRLLLNLGGAPPIFKRDYFAGFNCVAPAAQ